MSRFEQRLRARLENEEFAAGYREMAAELDLVRALDQAREQLHVSKEELALAVKRQTYDASGLRRGFAGAAAVDEELYRCRMRPERCRMGGNSTVRMS